MKKTILITTSLLTVILTAITSFNSSNANSANPSNGTAGAPADNSGATCTNCHAGTATSTTGVISSDIPGSGFVGGTTYNFTVTMSGSAAYGFEMTPQTATSNVGLGTWIAGTGTSVSGKYIKQSAKKTGASATWTFQWTAPTTATTVTFYGAFNYANNNNTTSGDIIKTSSATYLANTTGINNNEQVHQQISVFPNPTSEKLNILAPGIFDKGSIITLEGKIVRELSSSELIEKSINVSEMSKGIYFVSIVKNNQTLVSKFVKE